MSNSTIQYIQTHNTASVQPSKVLRGGSSVYVRVLNDQGNGKYTVSFAGNRVEVSTNRTLVAGQSFYATVQFSDDGKILLVPKNDAGLVENDASIKNIVVSSQLQNAVLPDGTPGAALASFLVAQGLVPDAATVKILQFLQQMGVKTDTGLMQKAQKIALHFPGKEKRAAEIAILLLEKGIEPDDSLVNKMLLLLDDLSNGEQKGGGHGDGKQQHTAQPDKVNADSSDDEISLFLNKLYDDIPKTEPGLLTLLNQLSTGEKHWLFLPYEWNAGEIRANGVIRILIDVHSNNLEKLIINTKTQLTKYFFVLYYISSKVKEVRFCTLPPLLPSKEEELRLGELLRSGMNLDSPVTVTYSTSALCDGLCTDETVPAFIADTATPEGRLS